MRQRHDVLAAPARLAARGSLEKSAPAAPPASARCGTDRLGAGVTRQGECAGSRGRTDRPESHRSGKSGSKRHVVVDRNGIPLAIMQSAANVHDSRLLEAALDAVPPLRLQHQRRGRPRKRPSSSTRTRAMTTHGAGGRCGHATSFRGSRGAASSRASGSGGIAGWWNGRSPGSTASGGSRCATSGVPTSTRPS